MKNPWFRFYSEVLNDPKVQTLPPEVFKVWVNCLCLANDKNLNGEIGSVSDVSFALRVTVEGVTNALHTLTERGIMITDGETFHLRNWKKRQYKSDNSYERVKRHRERYRNVIETHQNTDTDTDTDTDTEEKKVINKTSARKKISLEELSVNHIADWLSKKRMEGKYLHHDENFILEHFKNYCLSKGKIYADYVAAYRNAFEWDKFQPAKERIHTTSNDKSARARAAAERGLQELEDSGWFDTGGA